MTRLVLVLALLCQSVLSIRTKLSDFDPDVQAIINGMTLTQKIGQMTQLDISMFGTVPPGGWDFVLDEAKLNATLDTYAIGSILNSPLSSLPGQLNATQWHKIITRIISISLERGSRVPILYGLDSVHGANYIRGATIFPQQINAAATFNRDLVRKMGAVTGKDTRAIGIPWAFAPILGIAIQPSWARVYETFGEAPYVASEMGREIIIGMQGGVGTANLSLPTSVAACMKHFIGYSNSRSGHDRTPAWIPDRFLMNYFVPSFRAAVEAGVATAMESYHSINNVPLASSYQYLVELLRNQLQFDGMLVTDWAEIEDLYLRHMVASDARDAVRLAMQSTSIDMSMVPLDTSFGDILNGLASLPPNSPFSVNQSRIDVSAARVVQLKKDLGLLSNALPPAIDSPIFKSIGSEQDKMAALQTARESIVLLRNNGSVLPFLSLNQATSKYSNITFIGPSCNSLRRQTGGWSIHWQGAEDSEFWYGTTIWEAARRIAANISAKVELSYFEGVNIDGTPAADYNQALSAISSNELVVLCVGEDAYAEKPGDINDINLPAQLQSFISLVTSFGTPVVALLLEGRPRLLGPGIDGAQAVLHCGLPGPDGGVAIAEILFGLTNPSGRLPITYPAFPNAIHVPHWRPFAEEPSFPKWWFGTGLSYTTFSYSNMRLSANAFTSPSDIIQVSVTVRNSGPMAGAETVLLFSRAMWRRVSPEWMYLQAFTKVFLNPGQSQTVSFNLNISNFAFYDLDNQLRVQDGVVYQLFIPAIGEVGASGYEPQSLSFRASSTSDFAFADSYSFNDYRNFVSSSASASSPAYLLGNFTMKLGGDWPPPNTPIPPPTPAPAGNNGTSSDCSSCIFSSNGQAGLVLALTALGGGALGLLIFYLCSRSRQKDRYMANNKKKLTQPPASSNEVSADPKPLGSESDHQARLLDENHA